MKLSYSWLKEFLPELTLSASQVAELLTLHSFETVLEREVHIDPNILCVKITGIEAHPQADRLRLVTFTMGSEARTVVCGATNMQVGDIVPYAPPGAVVVDEEGAPFTIKVAKIRGMESPGMLNSPRELGLGDAHKGLLILPVDTPVGHPLREFLPDDSIFEADITPNRAHDAYSHWGVARELSALTGVAFQEPLKLATADLPELSDWQIDLEHSDAVNAFSLAAIEVAEPQPSSLLMQARLLMLGVRPINSIVDCTNYVMLEVGNPVHAYDATTLPGPHFLVRYAKSGEQLQLLDQAEASPLTDTQLVVTSADTPVALAGVMGGAVTAVKAATRRVLLEVANFQAYPVALTAAESGLRTESSIRLSKSLPSVLVLRALERLLQLLTMEAGVSVQGVRHASNSQPQSWSITFNAARVSAMAGTQISEADTRESLERIGCQIQEATEAWQVTVPAERLDLQAEHDLVEEVIRMIGLQQIESRTPQVGETVPLSPLVRLRERIKESLVASGGTELYGYSFEAQRMAESLGYFDRDSALAIQNPPSPEQQYLRQSLLPGILRALLGNIAELKQKFGPQERLFFEIGRVYSQGEGVVAGVLEEERLAVVSVAAPGRVLAAIHSIITDLGATPDLLEVSGHTLVYQKQVIGELQFIENRLLSALKKLPSPIEVAELRVGVLQELGLVPEANWFPPSQELAVQYQEASKYPSVFRDISVVVDPTVTHEQVIGVIERIGKSLVVGVELFDEYERIDEGTNIAQKSLAFHLKYQASDRTLTDGEIQALHVKIEQALTRELKARIR